MLARFLFASINSFFSSSVVSALARAPERRRSTGRVLPAMNALIERVRTRRQSRRIVPLLPALEGGMWATRVGSRVNAVLCEVLVCRGQVGLTALPQLGFRDRGRRES